MAKNLRIIPLGGLGEIGKNMTVFEYGRNMIIVDSGVMFPESDMYGIDLVLPDFDYVVQNQDRLRGIILTHGHMDHIAALPYLLREVNVPVYGTRLTLGLVERQLKEKGLLEQADLRTILPKETLHLGPFRVTPFAVAHSIPDSVGFVIGTPVGKVVHTGDYKLDETPAGGRTTDLDTLRELTRDGVIAMLGDSTNADRPGRTPTEQVVAQTLDRLFAEAKGQRIIIATFSSLLARLQEIMRLAEQHGRKVALTGRSLVENVELARDLGYLDVPAGLIVDIDARVPRDKLVILSTGSQGEPQSALNRGHDHHLRRDDPRQRGGRRADAEQAVRARRECRLRCDGSGACLRARQPRRATRDDRGGPPEVHDPRARGGTPSAPARAACAGSRDAGRGRVHPEERRSLGNGWRACVDGRGA